MKVNDALAFLGKRKGIARGNPGALGGSFTMRAAYNALMSATASA
jgi:hypothetical protein